MGFHMSKLNFLPEAEAEAETEKNVRTHLFGNLQHACLAHATAIYDAPQVGDD